jgi:flagellar biosynthesis/type III secretory pathway chaperone
MENITIGQISAFLGILAGIITSGSIIIVFIQKSLKKVLKNELEPISTQIKDLDVSQCKNFLVRFLADVEQGNELDKVELERAYEIYDHYINDLKQNSYIHNRWQTLIIEEKRLK